MSEYTEEQLASMYKEVEDIREILGAIEKILVDEEKGGIEKLDTNIINIDRKMLTEFERFKTVPVAIDKVVSTYHDWAWRTYYIAQQNQGRLKKGKLREHIIELYGIVATTRQIFKQ
jgi:hypothetical protein